MEVVFERPKNFKPVNTIYCPGCQHGVVMRIISEVCDELGLTDDLAMCYGIGCSSVSWFTFDTDNFAALHGRACAVATGFKRMRPNQPVITYQGDGDCAAIGLGDTLQAATRGENFTTVMVNNQNYGCTGGQMAPTTPIGMETATSPYGRSVEANGYPIHMAELVAQMEGTVFSARVAVTTPAQVRNAKKCLKHALELQMQGAGYTFVEFISACPSTYKVSPDKVKEYQEEFIFPVFKTGIFKDE